MAADISATMASLSATEGSNQPQAATSVSTNLDDNLRMLGALLAGLREASGWGGLTLSSVAGTNTITGSVAAQGSITMAPTAYSTGMRFHFIPAGVNTGATTLNVNSLGAKNIFFRGVALGGGELPASRPVQVEYDGTQFNLLTDPGPILKAESATTSGATVDITGIPAWVKKITVMVEAVSCTGPGSDVPFVRLGDGGGFEDTGYVSSCAMLSNAGSINAATNTTGFALSNSISDATVFHGSMTLTLQNAAAFTWAASWNFSSGATSADVTVGGGTKALSAALTQIQLVAGGAGAFDAGAVSVLLE